MSQQSNSSPSKNMPCSPSAEPSNPNREDPVADSVNTPHARRPKETVPGFSSSIVLEERTKEGSRYVHNAIATIVTGILSGNHDVPGVSIPLNTIEPDSVADQENTESLGKNISDDVEQTDAHKESNVDKPLDNMAGEEVHVTHDVSDNPNCEAETVDLEEFSDNELWKYVYQKRLALERELAQNVLDCKDIMDLIQEAGLMKNVTQFSKCYEMLVKEFIVNLSEEYADGKSKEFRKVYVRGKCVNFSPSVINKYLGRPDEAQPEFEVTDNKICQVITTNQFPNILTENDSVKKRDNPMFFNHKLFLGTHVPDIVITSGETSRVSNQLGKASVIAMFKETCRELEARKLNLEKLISSLEMTEGDVLADGGEFGEAAAVAEEAERQGEEGEADASPDDGTNDDADSDSDD
ncbi:uncharacterized protein LOC127131089 [Lathyrus oleraceus]|uniref:uncharacterized protein LOC127131089 n=1 Tax=Pisum sativum TaxID=3888 RepID=UPI0021D2150F|nr:uncharacterized protein LOC127131089 [Pisum sativum]